jgi:dolichol-phosphate mannosyltransferase
VSTETPFADLGRILVIIPTYNECENILRIVERLRTAVPEADVLIVDDNSPDGTGDMADELSVSDSSVHAIHRLGKQGLGAAYIAGFGWGLDQGYDVLVEMYADGSHDPTQLPRLLERLRTADLVLGSRYVPGGTVVNWPKSREFLSRGGNLYVRTVLGLPLADATGGYRAFRADALRALDLTDVGSAGYVFQVDLANRVSGANLRIAEVPITFVEREFGVSKMNGNIVAEALWQVTRWGARDRLAQVKRALGRA